MAGARGSIAAAYAVAVRAHRRCARAGRGCGQWRALGPKGLYGWVANADPDRLTYPLIRRAAGWNAQAGTKRWT